MTTPGPPPPRAALPLGGGLDQPQLRALITMRTFLQRRGADLAVISKSALNLHAAAHENPLPYPMHTGATAVIEASSSQNAQSALLFALRGTFGRKFNRTNAQNQADKIVRVEVQGNADNGDYVQVEASSKRELYALTFAHRDLEKSGIGVYFTDGRVLHFGISRRPHEIDTTTYPVPVQTPSSAREQLRLPQAEASGQSDFIPPGRSVIEGAKVRPIR